MQTEEPEKCLEILLDIKPVKQTDPTVLKFLVLILTGFGMNADCTKMLEHAN
jgi:hypothetical protein